MLTVTMLIYQIVLSCLLVRDGWFCNFYQIFSLSLHASFTLWKIVIISIKFNKWVGKKINDSSKTKKKRHATMQISHHTSRIDLYLLHNENHSFRIEFFYCIKADWKNQLYENRAFNAMRDLLALYRVTWHANYVLW